MKKKKFDVDLEIRKLSKKIIKGSYPKCVPGAPSGSCCNPGIPES